MGPFPQYDPKEKLIQRIHTSEGFDGDNALAFMKELRELLELKKLQGKYPHLNLYCNWCLHPELSRSNTIFRILEQITDIFLTENDVGPRFINQLNRLLSMENLRKEMLALLASENIPDYWISINENWYGFRKRLLLNIVRKPIQFPPGTAAAAEKLDRGETVSGNLPADIYLRIKKKSRGLGAEKLYLDDRVAGKRQGDVYWEVEISRQPRIRSRLMYYDPEAVGGA